MVTRAESKAETRERLINAGVDLVRDRGFGVSVDELARAAGLTKGAIYSNFGDRSELINAISDKLHYTLNLDLDLNQPSLADAMVLLGQEAMRIVDNERGRLILVLDFLVQMLRDEALRERAMSRADVPAERAELRKGEWLGSYTAPIDADDFNMLMNSLSIGMAVNRALYGREHLSDDLLEWAFRRICAPEPTTPAGTES